MTTFHCGLCHKIGHARPCDCYKRAIRKSNPEPLPSDERIARLEDLIHHAWRHTLEPDCARRQMNDEQKAMYDDIVRRIKSGHTPFWKKQEAPTNTEDQ